MALPLALTAEAMIILRCLGRHGMKVIFPDGKDNSLNKCMPSLFFFFFLTSHVDQSNRQCRFDPEFDQSIYWNCHGLTI